MCPYQSRQGVDDCPHRQLPSPTVAFASGEDAMLPLPPAKRTHNPQFPKPKFSQKPLPLAVAQYRMFQFNCEGVIGGLPRRFARFLSVGEVYMRRMAFVLLLLAAFPSVSQAHFLWLLADPSGSSEQKVRVYFGEAAEPDDPALLDRVAKAEVWAVPQRGEPKAVTLTKGAEALEGSPAAQDGAATIILKHRYGVVAKGGAPFLLHYYAKTHVHSLPGTWRSVSDAERLPLEVTAEAAGQETLLKVTWKGKPLAGSEIVVAGEGLADNLKGATDEAGVFRCRLPAAAVYSIRAKHEEAAPGKLDDKDYQTVRHYSTLSLRNMPRTVTPIAHDLPALTKGTTSFGGAVVGDLLAVYGGNYGSAHSYDNEDQSGDLWLLDLKKPGEWRQGPSGSRLQGLAMVEFRGALYRVGGFNALNKPGEKENLRSNAEVARWSPGEDQWKSLPDLPIARSSHDAALLGSKLYVVGGWNMKGGEAGTDWHDSAVVVDLAAEKLEWQPIAPPPFKRRALAVAAWQGKIVCVGGMREKGGPTTEVSLFDPATNAWSTGPSLLGESMDGFGSSAFAVGDSLYVTTISGSIQRLKPDGSAWELVGQLAHPRFFHRILPWGSDKLVVVGGSDMMTGKTNQLEVLQLK